MKNEVYFGTDCYVGNSMHKVYSAFLRGDTSLIDGFKDSNPQLFDKLLDLWMILSKNHKYFSTPKTTKSEKEEAAKVFASFTKKFPIYFPSMLDQTRFFAVRNGCDKLLYTFMEYENNLYLKK